MGDRHEVAAPVDGRSIIVQMGDGAKPLPRRWPQLTARTTPRPGSLIITQLRDRHEVAAPVDGHSIIVQMGDGAKLLPRRWTYSLLPGRSLALVVLIITQMGNRHEVAAPVDGRSIIVQMGDGAKPRPPSVPQIRL